MENLLNKSEIEFIREGIVAGVRVDGRKNL